MLSTYDIHNLAREIILEGQVLDLDKQHWVTNSFGRQRSVSLREYLLSLIDQRTPSSLLKVQSIYQLLITPGSSIKALHAAFAAHRSWIRFQPTLGLQVFHPEPIAMSASAHAFTMATLLSPVAQKMAASAVGTERATAVAVKPASRITPSAVLKPDAVLRATAYVADVPPATYRADIYQAVKLDPEALSLELNEGEIVPAGAGCAMGHSKMYIIDAYPVAAKSEQWIALKTLSMNDRVELLDAEAFELGYSASTQQYYVRLREGFAAKEYTLSYKLYAGEAQAFNPMEGFYNEAYYLGKLRDFRFADPEKIAALQSEFATSDFTTYDGTKRKIQVISRFLQGFKDAPLSKSIDVFNIEALNLMMAEAKGVCEQRAVIFMALAEILGIPARLVNNELHAYCEVATCPGGAYDAVVELGGGERRVEIEPAAHTAPLLRAHLSYADGECRMLEGLSYVKVDGQASDIIIELNKYFKGRYPARFADYQAILAHNGAQCVADSTGRALYRVDKVAQALAIFKQCRACLMANPSYDCVDNSKVFDEGRKEAIAELEALLPSIEESFAS